MHTLSIHSISMVGTKCMAMWIAIMEVCGYLFSHSVLATHVTKVILHLGGVAGGHVLILEEAELTHAVLMTLTCVTYHVGCGYKTLEMHNFSIQTYGRHSRRHIFDLLTYESKIQLDHFSRLMLFCMPIYESYTSKTRGL